MISEVHDFNEIYLDKFSKFLTSFFETLKSHAPQKKLNRFTEPALNKLTESMPSDTKLETEIKITCLGSDCDSDKSGSGDRKLTRNEARFRKRPRIRMVPSESKKGPSRALLLAKNELIADWLLYQGV